MLKFVDTRVCFQEVPDEISLCINISNCPHRCEGCHSSYLQEDIGEELNTQALDMLIDNNPGITCVCFMGGDNDVSKLCELAKYVQDTYNLKAAWYSGLLFNPNHKIDRFWYLFDYIKSGPYIQELGPLNAPTTNQKMWAKLSKDGSKEFYDVTDWFWNFDYES